MQEPLATPETEGVPTITTVARFATRGLGLLADIVGLADVRGEQAHGVVALEHDHVGAGAHIDLFGVGVGRLEVEDRKSSFSRKGIIEPDHSNLGIDWTVSFGDEFPRVAGR